MYTRREFGTLTLAGLVLPRASNAAGIDSEIAGVKIGVQTYSFRELARPAGGDLTDALIGAMTACGLGDCELWAPQIEPVSMAARDAAGSLPRDSPQVRGGGHDDLRVQPELQRRLL
jgi:hypothetical protein